MRPSQASQARIVVTTLLAGAIAGGCGHRESFRPAETSRDFSLEGYEAAAYDVSLGDRDVGEVKVWSAGAREVPFEGETRTLLHVGLEVENASSSSLSINPADLYVDAVATDDEVLEGFTVVAVNGPTSIAPGQSGRLDAYFEMPRGIEPDDLDAFQLRWALRDGREVHTEWTSFIERSYPYGYDDRYAYYYGYPYDPWYGPYGYPAYYGYPYAYPYYW